MTRRAALWITALVVAGCGGGHDSVTVGSNDFAEQKLLGEIMAVTLEEDGIRVERKLPSGDNRSNLLALQSGRLDLYPEYDGTLAVLVTGAVEGEGSAVASSLGLEMLAPFGYRNDFAVAVRRDVAIRHSLTAISDLANFGRPLRIATDEGFASRAVDGLAELGRRYGLPLDDPQLIPLRDRSAAYDALLNRSVDAAIVFTADAIAGSFGMRILEDDLDFFPDYRAAPLLRNETLDEIPEIRQALDRLAGSLSDETIRELVQRVDIGGEDYRTVARSFLGDIGILENVPPRRETRSVVTLALEPLARFDELSVRAFRAVREVMPARRLVLQTTQRPVEFLKSGEARYALVGADAFFELADDGRVRRVEGIEAVGVAGTRFAHLVARKDAGPLADAGPLRIGVAPEGSTSHRVAGLLAAAWPGEVIALVPIDDPLEYAGRLVAGDVDALFLMGSGGFAGLMAMLSGNDSLELRPVGDVLTPETLARYPFLRPARIPAGTFPGQSQPVASFSTQAVIAAATPENSGGTGDAGPANIPGLAGEERNRVQPRTAAALHTALGRGEAVDPVLPMSPGLLPAADDDLEQIRFQPAYALMNVFAVLFLVWVIALYFRPLPAVPALKSGRENDEQL